MQNQNFYKPVSWAMIVVVLLLSGTLFYLMAKKNEIIKPFTEKQLAEIPVFNPDGGGGVVDPDIAHEMIKQYHLKGRTIIVTTEKKLGLLHDDNSMRKYVDTIFPKFCAAHNMANTLFKDYTWRIGFYYSLSRKSSSSNYRLNVCLIPTLVNESLGMNDPKRVIDFYKALNSATYPGVYPKTRNENGMKQTGEDYIYDTGEIWP